MILYYITYKLIKHMYIGVKTIDFLWISPRKRPGISGSSSNPSRIGFMEKETSGSGPQEGNASLKLNGFVQNLKYLKIQ